MEIRVIKTPSRALKIANLNAAFAASTLRSLRLPVDSYCLDTNVLN
jgi:hypothetical protein